MASRSKKKARRAFEQKVEKVLPQSTDEALLMLLEGLRKARAIIKEDLERESKEDINETN